VRLAICGPTAVGKSALTIVYLSNNFPAEYVFVFVFVFFFFDVLIVFCRYDPTIEDSFTGLFFFVCVWRALVNFTCVN
jgi:GTPase SAR1 family protein